MGSSLFLTLFSGGGRYNVSSGRGGSGVTVVYLDRVLLLNLLVDYLLLLTTAQLAGIPLRRGRLALCAAVGALYAGAVFLPGLSWLSHPLCRTAGGAAMALAAWRREAHPWRLTALFFCWPEGWAVWCWRWGWPPAPWRHMWVGCIGQRSAGRCCWAQRWDFLDCCIWYSGRRPDMGEERSWTQPYPSEDRVVPCGCCTTRETPCEAPSPDSRCWCWSRRRWAGFCRRRWSGS